ncbi:MAG TPA: winged helix DNA-binding domain-containing protein [Dinghuibacter sp.]|uniref:winged helix DNA-binding domain-containing protein n=1 Tax=Dinghuibacter sp. TaxID=2024697 RepID=UPI002BE7AF74|nr:winged helix DNA-binding domain-containing protein [Dinghuibacter sp.]HTJ12101.1 winged helix DNA-binding domain-containing protein [Dinghuibacter sp.]
MTSRQIAGIRLHSQQIAGTGVSDPAALVRRMGCLQAQDFAGAKWALATRLPGIGETDIDRAFQEGAILRTHVLRPTWHFVSPHDIRWMLRLSAPKIRALSQGLHRKLGIDAVALRRSKTALGNALAGGKRLTRAQLLAPLRKARVNTDDIRMGFYLMDAEVEGLICSGGREGKQFTYSLLDDRAPFSDPVDARSAVVELATRYFHSRGPATVYDFAWWSGLTISRAQGGLEAIRHTLTHTVVRGQAYWFPRDCMAFSRPSVRLLPAYDEYTVAYRDRADVLAPEAGETTGNGIFRPILVVNGQVTGVWKRTETRAAITLEVSPLQPLGPGATRLLAAEVQSFGRYAGKPATLV